MAATNAEVIDLLSTAYNMEVETVLNYLSNSINLDGVRAEEIKKSLAADVTEEISHATLLGQRIKQIGGVVPGSQSLVFDQANLQTSENTTDVVGVIRAVIEQEDKACKHYKKTIRATEGEDYVTQDLCIRLLAAEEQHLIQFKGYLKEYTQG